MATFVAGSVRRCCSILAMECITVLWCSASTILSHVLRTRPDPFIEVWDEIRKLLRGNAGLGAKTVFQFLQRQNPGRFRAGNCAHCSGV
jgi:hypothetical protein